MLLVKSSGVKTWRFIYRFAGKQNRLGFGAYPETTLEAARRKAEESRAQIANGIDPSQVKKQTKQTAQIDIENAQRIGKRRKPRTARVMTLMTDMTLINPPFTF
ncbi:MAG: Arm DNA-binding domain-containing protein [Methylovulum sp.]|nr:Arm DNA-binding domain-containing protein [Methylovulum sp.]